MRLRFSFPDTPAQLSGFSGNIATNGWATVQVCKYWVVKIANLQVMDGLGIHYLQKCPTSSEIKVRAGHQLFPTDQLKFRHIEKATSLANTDL